LGEVALVTCIVALARQTVTVGLKFVSVTDYGCFFACETAHKANVRYDEACPHEDEGRRGDRDIQAALDEHRGEPEND
jgi:hypothetical protein